MSVVAVDHFHFDLAGLNRLIEGASGLDVNLNRVE
jgi:hypothetical protein